MKNTVRLNNGVKMPRIRGVSDPILHHGEVHTGRPFGGLPFRIIPGSS